MFMWCKNVSPDLCSLPDDDVKLARITGIGLKAWRRIRPRIIPRYFIEGSPPGMPQRALTPSPRIYNMRAREEALEWFQVVEKRQNQDRSTDGKWTVDGTVNGSVDGPYARSREKLDSERSTDSVPSPGTASASTDSPALQSRKQGADPPAPPPAAVSARCLARLSNRFPTLDLATIETKLLTYHDQHPLRNLDMAMVNWCKTALEKGIDLRNGHTNGALSEGERILERDRATIARLQAEKAGRKDPSHVS